MGEPFSRHFLRRTARAKASFMNGHDLTATYVVHRYRGRLFKWAVYKMPKVSNG